MDADVRETQVTPTLEQLLCMMPARGASDLYVTAGSPPMLLVDGVLQPAAAETLTPEMTAAIARQGMSDEQFAEFGKALELNAAYAADGQRFRLNVYLQRGSVALVARLIHSSILSFDDLGLPPLLADLVMEERGIVLVTGATGCGKSTTLAAMIDHRNRNSTGHIVTIEDPIEFTHEHRGCIISQREVGMDTHSFRDALKSALRQAPNVILIGEIRDLETAQFSLHASDTGHLVLSTLHTINANQTIERLINLFPVEQERPLLMALSLNLKGIISQRLVPRVGGGRAAAVEVLLNTARVAELIQQKKIEEMKEAMLKGQTEGMQTFDICLMRMVKDGRVDEPTALKYADSPNDLKLRLRGIGGSDII